MQWRARETKGSTKRFKTRWREGIQKIAGKNQILIAQNQQTWTMDEINNAEEEEEK